MSRERRLSALIQIVADVVIVVLAAYLLTPTWAGIFAIVLGYFFFRWWQRGDAGRPRK
jgi:hypothetical protein